MSTRNECLECLGLNIKTIRSHIEKLHSYETSKLYKELADILFFYGFKKEDAQRLINYDGDYEEFTDEELLEMEGVSNAILFHLKYKMD